MKRIFFLIWLLLQAGRSIGTAPNDFTLVQQWTDTVRSYEEAVAALNEAQVARMIEEFGLTKAQRRKFNAIYTDYRRALERGLKELPRAEELRRASERGQLQYLKDKLDNFATVAEIKRAYVDRFAEVLSPDEIRRLYNAESLTSSRLKEAAATRRRADRLVGSGRLTSRTCDDVRSDYTSLQASRGVEVTLGPGPHTVITADDNVIDYVRLDRQGPVLKIYINAGSVSNCTVRVTIPCSPQLNEVSATTAASIASCVDYTLGGSSDVRLSASSAGSISLPVTTPGSCTLQLSASSRYEGRIEAGTCSVNLSSASSASGSILCSGNCTVQASGASNLKAHLRAEYADIQLFSASSMQGNLSAVNCRLELSGSSRCTGAVELAEKAALRITSASRLNAPLTASSLHLVISSSSRAQITRGKVDHAAAEITSGSRLDASGLVVRQFQVTASSGSRADVYCTGLLKASCYSGSSITYDGDCRVEYNPPQGIRRR